jgi:hypothetical protein
MRTLVSCALVVVVIACADARGAPSAPLGSTYYVSPNGSDANPGTSPSAPWRTLAKAASFPLVPGDEVLLEGGQTFEETLAPYSTDAGSAAAPIGYASYGDGRATIARGIYLNSNSYLTFSDLNVTNSGAGAKGIFSSASGAGAVGIMLENLSVTNVAGYGIISDNPADSGWTIANVVIDQTGDSGVLFRGSGFTLTGSTITNTGTDSSISPIPAPTPRSPIRATGSTREAATRRSWRTRSPASPPRACRSGCSARSWSRTGSRVARAGSPTVRRTARRVRARFSRTQSSR